jgi:hypothetical protein
MERQASTSSISRSQNSSPREEDEEKHSEHKKELFKSLIKQFRNGTPLYRCQLPMFILDNRSLLDKLTDFFYGSGLIVDVAKIPSAEERFLHVITFFLSSWHHGPKVVKTPFNPILGEIFKCQFHINGATFNYIAEQITHHPPSSAFCFYSKEKNICLQAYIKPITKFTGNALDTIISGTLVGNALDLGESIELTYPKYVAKNVLFGTLKLEVEGKAVVRCPQTGYFAELEFKSKSSVVGKIFKSNPNSKDKPVVLYQVYGNWRGKVFGVNPHTKKEFVLLDVSKLPTAEKIVAPLEQQQPNESQKVWYPVTSQTHKELDALNAKTAIEDDQRRIAKEREQKGIQWQPKHFVKSGDTWVFAGLKDVFGFIPSSQNASSKHAQVSNQVPASTTEA